MTWEEAVKKAIQSYFENGDENLEFTKLKPSKYNKKYLDAFEESVIGSSNSEKSKGKSSA